MIEQSNLETTSIERRSLMELATCMGVITTFPSLKSRPRVLASSIRLGRSFDDVFDEALDRRSAQKAMTSADNTQQLGLDGRALIKYQKSWGHLLECAEAEIKDESERSRVVENSRVFVNSVARIENIVLEHPQSEWTIDLVKNYREAVCLLWAVYFASLAPKSNINMVELPPESNLDGPKEAYRTLLDSNGVTTRRVKRLYSGSLVYQIMGDQVSLKDRDNFIPGFGTLSEADSQIVSNVQQDYIYFARKQGMSLLEELGLVHVLPKLRRALNRRLSRVEKA